MPTDSRDHKSSDPDGRGSDDPDARQLEPLPAVFRLNRVAYFTVPMVAVVAIIMAGTSLIWLGWTLLVPVALAWWIHRLSTVVTADGVRAVHTLRTREVTWDELDGLQFPRWSAVRAVTTSGARVKLPAIGFDDLPRLSAASRGRIPDPFAIPDE